PNVSTVLATASRTWSSSRMSQRIASARPPACSTARAAVWMVPGSFGLATSDLAATTTLAPSRAARSAIARPMPREAPVMKRVLPERVLMACRRSGGWGECHAAHCGDGGPLHARCGGKAAHPDAGDPRRSRLRPLSLVVLPLQQPAGDEPVHRLAGAEPGIAHPGVAPQNAQLHRRERIAAVHALVLEQ